MIKRKRGSARKKICAASGLLALCMGFAPMQTLAASPEFAYTEEKWASLRDNKLEFDEIADLVHEYNTTVQQNELDYNDYKGKSSTDIANEYYDSASEVLERISYPTDDDSNYASQMSQALNSQIQADNLTEQGDNNVDDGDIIRLGYDQAEARIVKQAQTLMINYWNQSISLDSLSENVAQAESTYQSVVTKIAAGMALQSDLETAGETVTNAKTSLRSAQSNLEATKKSLCILLGWKYEDDVEIGTLPEPDLKAIGEIKIEEEIQKALDNNYDLKITGRRIANAQSATVRETQQKTYENQKETASTNVKNAYNSLILAKASYEQVKESLELQKNELAACEMRLAAGTITKNSYEKQKSSCKTMEISLKTQNLNLLTAQLEYDWAVKGLASTS